MLEQQKAKSKYKLTLLTKFAQQTERYQQMVQFANSLLLCSQQLSNAQRNLCSSAYKNLINNKRAQIKVLDAISKKLSSKDSKEVAMANTINKYRAIIQDQFVKLCHLGINTLDDKRIIKTWAEPVVFYQKLKGDFYRYLCEVSDPEGEYFTKASNCYQQADSKARSYLPPINEVRLSLHLNMSVFYYQHCGETKKALQLANRAFDEGVANVNETGQQSYKNCTMILQLIRDNINLWSQEIDA